MSAALLAAWSTTWGALERAGVHGPSAYWRAEKERFYLHPTARVLVEMVGRGGDKTRESVVDGIVETMAGEHEVPPGERHYFVHVAENKDEAGKTLAICESYLRLLGVPSSRVGDTIELQELPRGIRVLACRIGAVSGFRCFGWTADECAKWDDDGADPSAEVIASIRAMTVTHPSARGRIISSPVTVLGYFYEQWALGNTAEQLVGHAPSWVANDGITEEQTRKLERDPRVWAREYAAVPAQASDEALIDPMLVDYAQRAEPGDVPPERRVVYSAAMDPSLGRNSFTFVIAGAREAADGRAVASIVLHRQWNAARGQVLDLAAVLAAIGAHCAAYGCEELRTDQYHGESLAALAEKMNLPITVQVDKPTAGERLRRYESLLVRFMQRAVELPRDPQVRGDLLAIRRRVTKGSDSWTIHMAVDASGRHADYSPAIALAVERVAIESAEPSWIEAMRTLALYGDGKPPIGANNLQPGLWTVWANKCSRFPGFSSGLGATCEVGHPTRYNEAGARNADFRKEVEAWRAAKHV